MTATTILLVDDHKILRDGLKNLLEDWDDLKVIGEAENGRQAIELARELKPEIVIMDVTMPDMNGIEATHRLLEILPETKVLALSMHSDSRFVKRMLSAGASGYLLKECAFEELTTAMHSLMRNQLYVSPGASSGVLQEIVQGQPKEAGESGGLSHREREVLQLLAEGNSTAQIAGLLHLSVKTIETHRKNIMDKLELRSIAELTKYAIRQGLTSLD